MRRELDRLRDVLEAIRAIERHTGGGRAAFDRDELIRIWCLKHVEIIGEAMSRVPEEFRRGHPGLPWRQVAAMRNQLVHGYFQVDWTQVWAVVEKDLAPLRVAVEAILTAEAP